MIDDASTLENKSAVIGAVLKCHKIFNDFVGVNFSAHPEFVKEMSLFMLTEHVDPEEVADLKNIVCTMQIKVDSVAKTINEAKTNYESLNKQLGDHVAACASYKTEQKEAAGRQKRREEQRWQPRRRSWSSGRH
jgi:hypothetical protein